MNSANSPTVNSPDRIALAATTRMIPVPTLIVFQNSDSSIDSSTLSLTATARRSSLKRRKCLIIEPSAPATLIAWTAPNVSPSASVTRPVASRVASR